MNDEMKMKLAMIDAEIQKILVAAHEIRAIVADQKEALWVDDVAKHMLDSGILEECGK